MVRSICRLMVAVLFTTMFAQAADRNAFLDKAIELSTADVQIGHIGIGKAQNERVREFARTVVRDHSRALERLGGVPGAAALVQKVSKEHQQEADRLVKLIGADFDREFIKLMVRDHRAAIRFCEQAGSADRRSGGALKNSTNADSLQDTSAIAADFLPILRAHVQELERIQKELQNSNNRK